MIYEDLARRQINADRFARPSIHAGLQEGEGPKTSKR